MTPVERFQRSHGGRWAEMTRDPALQDALQVAHFETIQRITDLTDEEINTHGKEILADLRGRLKYENKLMELSIVPSNGIQQPEEEYLSPEEQALETVKPNGEGSASDERFLHNFTAPHGNSNPKDKKEPTTKEKRQANAAKARAAKRNKYQAKLKEKLSKSKK